MTAQYGIGMFFFGTTITLIGFLIAFLVINFNQKRLKVKEELTDVQRSLKELNANKD